MKAASVKDLKTALKECSSAQLVEHCLSLAKFKVECKELLTYLLFEADNEAAYVEEVKHTITTQFEEIGTSNYYYIKKSVRKILRNVKKYIRYSKQKETATELLLHFCTELKTNYPDMERSAAMQNIFTRQILLLQKTMTSLHEDLQYDYQQELNELLMS